MPDDYVIIFCVYCVHDFYTDLRTQRPLHCDTDRCKHSMTARCHVSTSLQAAWANQEELCELASGATIEFGMPYGANETDLHVLAPPLPELHASHSYFRKIDFPTRMPKCKILSEYRGSCGHDFSDIPCDDAFEMAAGRLEEPKCFEEVDYLSPLCSHRVKLPCWARTALQGWTPWGKDNVKPDAISDHHFAAQDDAQPSGAAKNMARKLCKGTTPLTRGCSAGHVKNIPCSDLYSYLITRMPLPQCLEAVAKRLECSHHAVVKCNKLLDPSPPCMAAIKERFTYPCGEHFKDVLVCSNLTDLRKNGNPRCSSKVPCKRYRCGHSTTTACYSKLSAEEPFPGLCLQPPDRTHGQATVCADTEYCASSAALPECTDPVTYCYPCGHNLPDIPCSEAFSWASHTNTAPPCGDIVQRTSPLCGHSLSLRCFNDIVITRWRPWKRLHQVEEGEKEGEGEGEGEEEVGVENDQDNADADLDIPDFEYVELCDERGDTVRHISTAHDEMQPGPAPLPVDALLCDGSVLFRRGQLQ